MSKKSLSILAMILLCLIFNTSFAQKPVVKAKPEMKFGKVSLDEFKTLATGKDSAAAAIKLFDIGDCRFEVSPNGNFIYVYERHIRYKILNKNGYDYANYTVGLQVNSSTTKESLENMNGATYNLENGNIVTSKLNKDAKFTEEVNKNYTYKKFALPNVKEGSIIEFKYRIKSDFIFTLRGWSFQSNIPTLWSEYSVTIPEYFIYKFNQNGNQFVENTQHQEVQVTYIPNLSSRATLDKFVAQNVPALKSEPYISNIDDYKRTLDFELRSTHFPNSFFKDYTSTWPKIITGLVEDENFGGFIKRNSYAKANLVQIIKNEKDSLTIANAIYDYVKKNLKWDNNYNIYSKETNPKNIFDKKTGNSADINLSLISLLREAKFNISPILISTRSNGKHPGFPTLTKFDNVIGLLKIGDKTYKLDATQKDMPFGLINYQNLNHEGLALNIDSKEGGWISTESEIGDEVAHTYYLNLNKEHKLTGNITSNIKGYKALSERINYRNAINQSDFIKSYKSDKTGLEITQFKVENLDSLNQDFVQYMDVEIEDNVEEAGNLVYFSPLLYERTKENPFKFDERLYPVDFAHPIKESYKIILNYPEDYTIETLPKLSLIHI